MDRCSYCVKLFENGLRLGRTFKVCRDCALNHKEKEKFLNCFIVSRLDFVNKALYYLVENSIINENEFNNLYKTYENYISV